VPTEHADLLRSNAELHETLTARQDEIAADERAATIFGSVEELYRAYDGTDPDDDVNVATLRQVNWGLRTVEALIDDEEPPAVFKIQEPDRWAYTKTLIAAGSFGLLVALILYEIITRG
jgi:hypothetical protein